MPSRKHFSTSIKPSRTFHVECDVSSINRRRVPYYTRLKANFDRLLCIIFFITQMHAVCLVVINGKASRVRPSKKKKIWKQLEKNFWKKNFEKKVKKKKNFGKKFWKKNFETKILWKKFKKYCETKILGKKFEKYCVMSRFQFSISPVQVRELTLYTLLRPTPHIVIPVLGLFPQENYQAWGSRKRIYLLRK